MLISDGLDDGEARDGTLWRCGSRHGTLSSLQPCGLVSPASLLQRGPYVVVFDV